MITRPATISDVTFVLRNMSAQNRRELETCGLSKKQFSWQLTHYLEKGEAIAGEIDDRPQWFLILASENGVTGTMFAATEEFFGRGALHVRPFRKILKELRDKHGPLYSLSTLPHPETRRWFKALGYKAQERPDGNVLFVWE